jgi:hypothetical protein
VVFHCGVGKLNANEEGLSSFGEGAGCSGEWAECGALCGEGDEEDGVAEEEGKVDAIKKGMKCKA